MDWNDFSAWWLADPWLVWGVGAYVSSAVGFLVTAVGLELLLHSGALGGSEISYASSSHAPRDKLMSETHKRISFRKQVQGSLKFILGVPTISASLGLAVAMQLLCRTVTTWWPTSFAAALLQLLALALVNDFGLYWGHRIQHESVFLWRFHSKHHAIDTPSPFSTLFIHPVDATLQGSLPLLVAGVLLQPPPGIMYLFLAGRLAENAINHSGLDSALVDVLTLKVLPLRASIAHHDAHHKYSNHALGAKNYGESFVVWDVVFGTSSSLTGAAHASAAKLK